MTETKVTPVSRACPLMSTCAPVPEVGIATGGEKGVLLTHTVPTGSYQVVTMVVPCIREKCQWWSEQGQDCGVVAGMRATWTALDALTTNSAVGFEAVAARLGSLQHLSHLEPPRSGKSPIDRLAEAVEKLVDLWKDRGKKGGT